MLSEPPARRVRVADDFAVDPTFFAPARAAEAVPLAPDRAVFAVSAAAPPADFAVVAAAARVVRAERDVLPAPDCAVFRVLVAADFACVDVRPAARRVLLAVDLAPVRAAAWVRCASLPGVDELLCLAEDFGDDEREPVDGERLAGGMVRAPD
ncbi:MAG TPA: hypothetical protein VG365_09370 [Solirubrobacteraceae bacterium]|jgi:hypothetical protein|nr:hypothetical protein [Solirubrobacteraceae bacterium]